MTEGTTATAPDLLGEVGKTLPMERFDNTANGNADRFWSMHQGTILLNQQGKTGTFYTVQPDGRWRRNDGGGAGDEVRRARDTVGEMRRRALHLIGIARAAGDDKQEAQAMALLKWANRSDSLFSCMDMARTACLSYGAVIDPDDDFDADRALLATPGSVLELGQGVGHRQIHPDDRITFSTGVDWKPEILDKDREPVLIRQYLDTFIGTGREGAEKTRLIFKALGTSLLGGNSHRLLIILQGNSGTNGKTQLVEALRATLGTYAGIGTPSIFRGNLEDRARPDVISLLKKRVAFLAEASKAWELHGDRVKAITGGDGVKLRRMRVDEFLEVVPQFTPVIYTNEMPRVHGADRALKRRMLVIDFERQPEKEDPTVKQRFLESQEVQEWLLAALVRGYQDAAENGVEDVKAAFSQGSEKGFQDTTHLGEFFEWMNDSLQLHECTEAERQSYGIKSRYLLMKDMHERYQYWAKAHGNIQDKKDVLNYREFNAALRDQRGWVSIKNAGLRWEGWQLRELELPRLRS